MKKQPKEITVCSLSVVLMPQGEIICYGKTVGWFKELGKDLTPANVNAELKEACKEALKWLSSDNGCPEWDAKKKVEQAIKEAEK